MPGPCVRCQNDKMLVKCDELTKVTEARELRKVRSPSGEWRMENREQRTEKGEERPEQR